MIVVLFSKKRAGIGYALAVLFMIIFAFGIIWAVLYYGLIIPAQSSIGTSWSDSLTLQFMETMALWWPFIVLIAAIIWLLNRSNKQELSY
jgi:cbb3-type cytochrome oxidase subunit 3